MRPSRFLDADFRRVLDALPDGIVAADTEGSIVYVNAATSTLLGWAPGALVGQPLRVLMPARIQSAHDRGFRHYLETRVPRVMGHPVRLPALRADGSEVEIELTLSSVATSSGDEIFLGAMRDLRDLVELERQRRITKYTRAVAESAAKLIGRIDLDAVLDSIVTAMTGDFDALLARVWLYEPSTASLHLEASAGLSTETRASGRARIDVVSHPFKVGEVARTRRAFVSNDPAADPQFDQAWIAREGIASVAAFPLLVGAELRGVIAAFFPYRLEPELSEILATFSATVAAALNDVQLFAREQLAREEAELARRQAETSEQRYRFLAESIPQLVWTADPEGACDYVNQRWREYSGAPVDALLGWSGTSVLHEDHAALFVRRVKEAAAAGEGYEMELLLRRADGRYRWHLARALPLSDAKGTVVKWFGTCTDIDDRKRGEEAQRFLTEATATLVSSLDYGATLASVARLAVPFLADGCVIDVLEADGKLKRIAVVDARADKADLAARLLRLGPPGADAPIHRVLAIDRAALVGAMTPETLETSARDAEHLAILKGLDVRSGIIAPLRARGRSIGIVWLYASESGRHGAHELALAEDLAARVALALDNARLYRDAQDAIRLRDEFLSIASHELKTPLTPLKLQLARLRRESTGDATAKLEVADRQVDRLAKLVNQLLDVTRITGGRLSLELEEVDLSLVVESVVLQHESELLRSGSALRLDVAPAVTGEWDALRMEQVVSNLLTNAIKYGEGRPIELALALTADASIARLVVKDAGIGIEEEDQTRIFGRFERAVSTRHYGGFGLGLWIVRQVIEASGGSIQVSSAPKQGSTFTVEIPRRAGRVE